MRNVRSADRRHAEIMEAYEALCDACAEGVFRMLTLMQSADPDADELAGWLGERISVHLLRPPGCGRLRAILSLDVRPGEAAAQEAIWHGMIRNGPGAPEAAALCVARDRDATHLDWRPR